jgi:hypothetical protein
MTAAETASAPRSLHRDERGAVMFMGVFMALFLVGSLWFLVGIGDAIVFRESVQEATDAAVFSSAVIHAKGMNIIAFLNCLMLAIVFIYLVIALVVDALLLLAGIAASTIVLIEAVPELVEAAQTVDKVAKVYKTGMAVALPIAAGVQTAVAYLAPWGGTLAAAYVSHKYGFFTIAVGPSNVPGTDASVVNLVNKISKGKVEQVMPDGGGRRAALEGATGKLGLPVASKAMNFLCAVAVAWVLDKLMRLLAAAFPIVGPFQGRIRGFLNGILGPSVTALHCREDGSGAAFDPNDLFAKKKAPSGKGATAKKQAALGAAATALNTLAKFTFSVYAAEKWWGDAYGGPKALYSSGVTNGSEWLQIWGFTPASLNDAQNKKVRVATYHAGSFRGVTRPTQSHTYTAQSEFYYDCKQTWGEDGCNGSDAYDYTMYSMRWRARIVRYRGFGLASFRALFADFLGEFVTAGRVLQWFKTKVGLDKIGSFDADDTALVKKLKKSLINAGQNNEEDLFGKAVKDIVSRAKGAVQPPKQGTKALH